MIICFGCGFTIEARITLHFHVGGRRMKEVQVVAGPNVYHLEFVMRQLAVARDLRQEISSLEASGKTPSPKLRSRLWIAEASLRTDFVLRALKKHPRDHRAVPSHERHSVVMHSITPSGSTWEIAGTTAGASISISYAPGIGGTATIPD